MLSPVIYKCTYIHSLVSKPGFQETPSLTNKSLLVLQRPSSLMPFHRQIRLTLRILCDTTQRKIEVVSGFE